MAVMAMMLVWSTLHYNSVKTVKLDCHTVTVMPSSELKLSHRIQMEIKHKVSQTITS